MKNVGSGYIWGLSVFFIMQNLKNIKHDRFMYTLTRRKNKRRTVIQTNNFIPIINLIQNTRNLLHFLLNFTTFQEYVSREISFPQNENPLFFRNIIVYYDLLTYFHWKSRRKDNDLGYGNNI